MKIKNAAIIESPFQLLGLIEAISYFKIDTIVVIVKYTDNIKNNTQIDWLLKKYQIKNAKKLTKFKKGIVSDFMLLSLIFFWKIRNIKFDFLFAGDAENSIMRVFISNLNSSKKYFLDDGSQTVYIQEKIIKQKRPLFVDPPTLLRTKLRRLLYKLFQLKYPENTFINMFTCFKLNAVEKQDIQLHTFNFLTKSKGERQNNSLQKNVYFIGGNLSEVNILSEEHELLLLSKISEYYTLLNLNIIYCCHRRESESKLEKIKSKFKNIKLYTPEYPLEIEFIIKNISIEHIGSFFSTALYTTTLIHKPKSSNMFKIPTHFLNPTEVETIESVELGYSENKYISLQKDYL